MMYSSIIQPSFGRIARHILFGCVLLAWAAWTATALSFHFEGGVLFAGWSTIGLGALFAVAGRIRSKRIGWAIFIAAVFCTAGWYQTLRPAEARDWAFGVAHGVKAEVDGDIVRLRDVRNFEWQNENRALERWEARTYDVSKLKTVDMITSVWDSPDIAHLLVSFGFEDGEHVVFSVETRKEAHESFSAIGGFFRQFELILVAATEEDIVKLRTNYRQEDVRLYPIDLNADQRRDLFMSYVAMAQDLEAQPAFYHTLLTNCTTSVFRLARILKADLRPDWRIILSGNLAEYADAQGAFAGEIPIDQRIARAAISAKAQAYQAANFSKAIRQ